MAEPADETPAPEPTATPAGPRLSTGWRTRLAAARQTREHLLPDWQQNVNYRVMQPFSVDPNAAVEADRVAVPEDWARTKQKQSQLSFQLPKIVATHARPDSAPFAPLVTAAVNQVLRKSCRAHYMIDECLADVVNAAGLMVSVLKAEIVTDEAPLPQASETQLALPGVEPQTFTRVHARRFTWTRISPADFLWPAEFRSSDWDRADWLGYDALVPVEVCKRHPVWGPKIAAAEGTAEAPEVITSVPDSLASDVMSADTKRAQTVPCYRVTEIWYRAARLDEDALHPDHLRTVVLIDGIKEPVQQGDADEQVYQPPQVAMPAVPALPGQPEQPGTPAREGYFKGLSCFPIRVQTLTYVSDLAVPPSDSRAARAQVNELMRSRAQLLRQRDTAIPIRWYDVNRVDEEIVEQIRRGTWQDLIPMNGPGDRAIGEVARANYPRENLSIMGVISRDLDGAWSLSNNQLATPNDGARSATEVAAVGQAASVRLDYEKARVNRYLAEGAAVLWSLMARYQTGPDYVEILGPDGAKTLTQLPTAVYGGAYQFDFVPDTSDRLDLATRQANVLKLYNLCGNSSSVRKSELEKELFLLHGYDPERFVTPPPPPQPDAANLSMRLSGEDLLNPIAVALVLQQHNLTPQDIAAAAALIKDAIAKTVERPPAGIADDTPTPTPSGPPVPQAQPAVEPPETVSPILKRSVSGEHLT